MFLIIVDMERLIKNRCCGVLCLPLYIHRSKYKPRAWTTMLIPSIVTKMDDNNSLSLSFIVYKWKRAFTATGTYSQLNETKGEKLNFNYFGRNFKAFTNTIRKNTGWITFSVNIDISREQIISFDKMKHVSLNSFPSSWIIQNV